MKKLFLLLSLMTLTLFANLATVVDKVGVVTLKRDSKITPLELKAELKEHDIVMTAKNSKVKIFFYDNTAISLGENSSLSIDAYLFDDSAKSNIEFSVLKGFFKTVTGRIGEIAPKRFKLKTKNATIGIRGTVFAAAVNFDGESIICTDGEIDVDTPYGRSRLPRGQELFVYKHKKSIQRTYTKANKKALLKKSGWSGSKNIKELIQFIKANFQAPLREELLSTVANILKKDSDSKKEYFRIEKIHIENADDIAFIDDIEINGREFDSLNEREIEFYRDDLIDGKVFVSGILESEDENISVEELFVEVSTDGGKEWQRASGHAQWQWSFKPKLQKPYAFSLRVVREKDISNLDGENHNVKAKKKLDE